MKKGTAALIAALGSAAALGAYIAWENNALEISNFEIASSRLPKGFDGYKIALLSDLHSRSFGKNNSRLLSALKAQRPDLIAMTGDIFDRTAYPRAAALKALAEGAAKIAPCYFVSGNHEAKLSKSDYMEFMDILKGAGVRILNNERTTIERGGDELRLLGLADFKMDTRSYGRDIQVSTDLRLSHLSRRDRGFQVLLTHRPEQIEIFAHYGIDLVLSGHTHGGQWRLPFLGAVYIPNQGLFPAISDGKYREDETEMIVTRGLGSSNIRFRAFNRPEIAMVTLKSN